MAGYTMEKTRAQSDLANLEKQRTALIQNLGTLVYNLHASEVISIEQCSDIYNEIVRCDQMKIEIEAYLQQLEMQRIQQQQMNRNPYGYYGGAPQQPVNGVFCRACGAKNSEASKFCSGCGSPMQG